MKLIRVWETDEKWRAGFLKMADAKATDRKDVYEVDDDFAVEDCHGIEAFDPEEKTWEETYPEEAKWIAEYSGTFPFYLSLQTQYLNKKRLSEKQTTSITKAIGIQKLKEEVDAGNPPPLKDYTIKVGDIIRVARWLGIDLAQKAHHVRPHYIMEVVEVLLETPKAYRLRVRLSAQKTSHCGVCGAALTDAKSVAAGIGPICAEKYGIAHGETSLKDLEKFLINTIEVVSWMPKKSIKQRFEK